MPDRKIVFVHVPKTAGTSFLRQVVATNIPRERWYRFSGFCRWLRDDQAGARFIHGHVGLGLGRFKAWIPEYITFLRDPVDRCLSYHAFIQSCPRSVWCSPDRPAAERLSLHAFCRLPRVRNLQTRYLAGIPYQRLPRLGRDKRILRQAQRNLQQRIACFGLQEAFTQSIERFATHFGWRTPPTGRERHGAATGRRPLDALPTVERSRIESANSLDRDLYAFARELFARG